MKDAFREELKVGDSVLYSWHPPGVIIPEWTTQLKAKIGSFDVSGKFTVANLIEIQTSSGYEYRGETAIYTGYLVKI